jgi:DNA polymerase III psi subunit
MMTLTRDDYLHAMGFTPWIVKPVISEENTIEWQEKNEDAEIIFLADPQSQAEKNLLNAIVDAFTNKKSYGIGNVCAQLKNDALFPERTKWIILFGTKQSEKWNLSDKGIFERKNKKIIVTHSLSELILQPAYKKELWNTWKNAI